MSYKTFIVHVSVTPPASVNTYAEVDLQVNKIFADPKNAGYTKLVSISVLSVTGYAGGYFLVTISK